MSSLSSDTCGLGRDLRLSGANSQWKQYDRATLHLWPDLGLSASRDMGPATAHREPVGFCLTSGAWGCTNKNGRGWKSPTVRHGLAQTTGIRALRPPAESTTNPPDFDPSLAHRAGSTVRRCVSVNWPATGRLSWRRGCAMPRAWRGAGSCSRGESGQRERARPTHAEGDVAIPRGITQPWESACPTTGECFPFGSMAQAP